MPGKTRIGIIICDRYRSCAGGKCLKALRNHAGAFASYGKETELELVGFTSCGGCPGGNVEYAPEEMIRNGAEVIHLATGLVGGFPPCPHIDEFRAFISGRYGLKVIVGTHPIPTKYLTTHEKLGSWASPACMEMIQPILASEKERAGYD
jgi:predicted metal-binding protein